MSKKNIFLPVSTIHILHVACLLRIWPVSFFYPCVYIFFLFVSQPVRYRMMGKQKSCIIACWASMMSGNDCLDIGTICLFGSSRSM